MELEGDSWKWYGGRVILVKLGDYTRCIGIDGSPDAINKTIKSTFRLRTNRAFWLENVDDIVRTLDQDMPLGYYTLHVDEDTEFATYERQLALSKMASVQAQMHQQMGAALSEIPLYDGGYPGTATTQTPMYYQ